MFEYMTYNIAPWGYELAVYFFLIGTGGMVYVLATAPQVFGTVAQPLVPFQKTGLIVSLVILLFCTALLIYDLGQPARFFYPMLYFHWTSPVSWGTLFLPLFGLCIVLFWFGLYTKQEGFFGFAKASWLRLIGVLGSLLALSMPLYTGLDLMVHQSRELWSNPTIPVLFVILSITSGAALAAIILLVMGRMTVAVTVLLRNILLFSVAVTFFLFWGEWVTLTYASEEQLQAWDLMNGIFAVRFWLLTLVIGTVIPPRLARQPLAVTVAGIAGSVGAYSFREVLLYGGQLTQLYY